MSSLLAIVVPTMPSMADCISPAWMPNCAIASVAMLAALPKSAPVALASNTVDLAAPSRICCVVRPAVPSAMMASEASVALTLSVGSSPKSMIRSLSLPVSSAPVPIAALILAMRCSMSAAPDMLPARPAARPVNANTAPPAAALRPMPSMSFSGFRPRDSSPSALFSRCPRESLTSPMGPDARLTADRTILICSFAIICGLALPVP